MSALASRKLAGISSKAYQHPADRAATAALQSIPGIDGLMRKLIEMRYERALRQGLMSNAVRVGPTQLPAIWSAWEDVVSTLDLAGSYQLYVTQDPITNAAAVGSKEPIVVMNSSAISLLDEHELKTVLAHEAGHIHSDHVLYWTTLMILLQLAPLGRAPSIASLPVVAVRTALLEWSRAAELSCDRAATLVNRDPVVTSRTLMVMASGLPSKDLDVNAFLRQAQDYDDWESGWDRLRRQFTELNLTHSSPVRRVAELMAWVRSGDYDRIVGGDYRKREEPPDVGAEADAAVRHYRARFERIFADTDENLSKVMGRVGDWVQGKRS
jgi:Zn-dependent protease with chaperone function